MKRYLFLLVPWLVVCAETSIAAASGVRLGTNVAPSIQDPDTTTESGSIAHVTCILKRLKVSHQIQPMPWFRAREQVFSGNLDGFFTAMPRIQSGADTRLSAPLVLENWYWYWRADAEPPSLENPGIRVGVVLGSHQAQWLEQVEHPVDVRVNSLPQLLKLMLIGRIDSFIADREQFEQAALDLGMSEQHYESRFQRYVPLGVRFGEKFIQDNPGFLADFDRSIYPCATAGFELSAEERRQITALLWPRLEVWLASDLLPRALDRHNHQHRNLNLADIKARDEQWRAAFRDHDYSRVEPLLDRALSDFLAAGAADTDGAVTEIIVMDQLGLNVGVSAMTSDYWQGDEAKYQQVYAAEPDQLVFESVVYDKSTRRFQIQVGMPLYSPETGEPVGVITMGVDVEQVLSVR